MRIEYHPRVESDLAEIVRHYTQVASHAVAEDFVQEFQRSLLEAADRPESFAVRWHGYRRVNLRKFSYNFLFRITGDGIRILVLRHNRRRETYGIRRR